MILGTPFFLPSPKNDSQSPPHQAMRKRALHSVASKDQRSCHRNIPSPYKSANIPLTSSDGFLETSCVRKRLLFDSTSSLSNSAISTNEEDGISSSPSSRLDKNPKPTSLPYSITSPFIRYSPNKKSPYIHHLFRLPSSDAFSSLNPNASATAIPESHFHCHSPSLPSRSFGLSRDTQGDEADLPIAFAISNSQDEEKGEIVKLLTQIRNEEEERERRGGTGYSLDLMIQSLPSGILLASETISHTQMRIKKNERKSELQNLKMLVERAEEEGKVLFSTLQEKERDVDKLRQRDEV